MTYKMHISVTIEYLSLPKVTHHWLKGTEHNESNYKKIGRNLFIWCATRLKLFFKEQHSRLQGLQFRYRKKKNVVVPIADMIPARTAPCLGARLPFINAQSTTKSTFWGKRLPSSLSICTIHTKKEPQSPSASSLTEALSKWWVPGKYPGQQRPPCPALQSKAAARAEASFTCDTAEPQGSIRIP